MPQKKTKLSASPSLARTAQRSAPRYEKKRLTFPDHLLGIRELTPQQIHQLIDRASHIADEIQAGRPCKPALSGRTLINLFYEDSTRTRTSFELAGKNLGATVINISLSNSSIKKGETLLDTAATLNAMRPDILVMRHQRAGAAHLLAPKMNCSLVNAGDGAHEHPTQALLDALTIKRHKGKFEGLRIALCGDILHSRVARSNILLLNALGANLRVIAPGPLLPKAVDQMGVEMFTSMREGLRDVDIIMMLRLQTERMSGSFVPSRREYFRFFGLDREKLSLARDDALVLHPGPINRGLEIDPEIADGPQSLIREQVEMGIAIRMAVLAALSLRGAAS